MHLPTVDEWRTDGRRLRFRDHEIFVRTGGRGPVVLLIHGFPSASWDWCKLWPDLSARFTLVAPDLLGFGLSAKPRDHDYRIAEQADLCLAVLDACSAREARVIAHDYGDTVAQELLARLADGSCPVDIPRMVLLNGGLFPETHRPSLIQRLLRTPLGPWIARATSRGAFHRTMRRIFGPQTPPTAAELDALWQLLILNDGRRAMPRLIRYIDERREHRSRWVGALQTTAVPLTLIDGLADPISGHHMVERFRALVPRAAIVGLAHVGHYPHLEAPAAVRHAIENALV